MSSTNPLSNNPLSTIGTWEYDIETAIFSVCDNFNTIVKSYPKSGNIEDFYSQLLAADATLASEALSNAVANGIPFSIEIALKDLNVKENTIQWSGLITQSAAGKNSRVSGLLIQKEICSGKLTEIQNTVSTLQKRNEFIETILENLPIGIAVNDVVTGEASTVNEMFCKTYGWDDKDLLDTATFFEKVYPDENYRNQIMGQIMSDIQSGDPKRMIWNGVEIMTKKAERRIINAKNIPVLNQNLMISTVTDVTKEYYQSKEIERIKNNQEALINNTADFIWYVSTDLKFVTINDSLKKYIKKYLNKEIKEGDSALYSELGVDNYNKWKKIYEKALASKKLSFKDKNFNPITNKMEYRNISINPIYDANGVLTGLSCYSKNKDKDAKYLFELEKTKAELKNIMDFSLDMICTIDEAGNFIHVSDASEIIIGYSPAELINTAYMGYVIDEDHEKTNTIAREILEGQEASSFINRYVHKNGSIIAVEWSARWDNTEKLMFCIGRDVTEKRNKDKIEQLERSVYEEFSDPNNSISKILSNYTKGIEDIYPTMICSFLQLRGNNLFSIADNRLPKSFNDAIEGVEIGQNIGSCGTAAYTKNEIIVSDIANDIRWKNYKEIALANNLKACWSIPIMNSRNEVMATFAIYYNEAKIPSLSEKKLLRGTSKLLQVILENDAQKKEITLSNQRYEYVTKVTFDAIWDWNMLTNDVYWADNYYELFGNKDSNDTRSDLDKIQRRIHPEELEEISKRISEAIKSTENSWSFEHQYLKTDGSYAQVINKALIVRDASSRAIRVIGSMQDITKQKEEIQRLKLMQSVVANANDAIIITETVANNDFEPKIIYANGAFSEMSGYLNEEVVGRNAGFLRGIKSDPTEVNKLYEAIQKKEACEVTMINYKKNGEEFWNNFTIYPVKNEKGIFSNWVAVERDVTNVKTEALYKSLTSDLSIIFNQKKTISELLQLALEKVTHLNSFDLGELWLFNPYQQTISLQASYSNTIRNKDVLNFNEINSLQKKEPQLIWDCITKKEVQFISDVQNSPIFSRKEAAKKIGLKAVYAIPLSVNRTPLGVILVGSKQKQVLNNRYINGYRDLGHFIGQEIKRKQLENELNYMFDTAPDILCLLSVEGYFQKVNPSATVLLGYNEESLLSIPFNNLIHPQDLDFTNKEFTKLSINNPIIYFENRLITEDKKTIWLDWSITKDSEQNLYFGVAKDITHKKELEQLLDKAMNLAKMGSWDLNVETKNLFWSTITKEIHEVPKDFIPEVASAINLYKEGIDRELIRESVNGIMQTGEKFEHELQITTTTGNNKWIKVIGEAEFHEGKCIRVYGSFQDINSRKQAEIGLQKAFEEKNTILESIGDAFFRVDKNWNITYWNRKAEITLHKSKNEVINRNFWDIYPDVIDTAFHHNYLAAFDENKSKHFEAYYEGFNQWYEVSAYPYDNGLSIYFRDVTERKKIQIEMEELYKDLKSRTKDLEISNNELEQFAYIASHDLQEPLRMVTSFLSLIEKKYEPLLDEKGKKYIHFAVDGAKRMRQIILDLLEFSRVGKETGNPQNIDINEIVQEIKAIHKNDSKKKNTTIAVPSPLPIIYGHKLPLQQVFQNLISNAVKYVSPGKEPYIEINYESLRDYHKFTIVDNGIGIDKKYYDKIFNIFQRLHQKEEYMGTGIGLAITKKIIENLGGTIGLHSILGEGSSFYFTLPKE